MGFFLNKGCRYLHLSLKCDCRIFFLLIFFRICLHFNKFPQRVFVSVLLTTCVQTWSRVSLVGKGATLWSGHLTGTKNPTETRCSVSDSLPICGEYIIIDVLNVSTHRYKTYTQKYPWLFSNWTPINMWRVALPESHVVEPLVSVTWGSFIW